MSRLVKERGVKNAFFGIISQLLIIAVGLIIPRLVLVHLGSEANGLLNSVNSVLTYMSLLEAGMGTMALQALYKPCAEQDHDAVNGIMAAIQRFYRRSGLIYLAVVFLLSFAYSCFVKTDLPRADVFLVVLLCGLTGVLSFFFQGKIKLFLSAEGCSYVTTNIASFTQIAISLLKAALLTLGFNVVAVQASVLAANLMQSLLFYLYMRRRYPWVNARVKPNLATISQKNAVMVHQVSTLIFNNTDTLLLTLFATLKEVSVYAMYALIFTMVASLSSALHDSYTYALGQTYSQDRERFMRMFNAFEVYSLALTFSLFCIAKLLILPFLKLYTAGVYDISYIDRWLPWLFVTFYLMHNGRISSATVINIAQRFEDTKWRSVLESCINLTVSLIAVQLLGVYGLGIYGVLIGTIAALLYRTNDMILYASGVLGRSCRIPYRRWLRNLAIFAVIALAGERFPITAENYWQLLISGAISAVVCFSVFLGINSLCERESMRYALQALRGVLRGRFRK